MDSNEYIGLDLGKTRTGFARGNDRAKIAEPLDTVDTPGVENKIKEILEDTQLAGIVVGLPRNLDGNDTDQTRWVRAHTDELKENISLPIYFQDEALTSKLAEAKRMSKGSGPGTDALAAAIILQDFLDSREAERVIA